MNHSLGTTALRKGLVKMLIYNAVYANGCIVSQFHMCGFIIFVT